MFLKAKSIKKGDNMAYYKHIASQFFTYWIRDCENGILVNKKTDIFENKGMDIH
jgi:predicted branched-subunit amino acid permease